MDDPNADPDEIEASFRFIRVVNRRLGGISSLIAVLEQRRSSWPTDRPFRWLDVATGAADIPLAVDAWATERGLAIECVGLDKLPACLAVGQRAVAGHPRIAIVEGDALTLDQAFPPGGFDLVHAAMFLHHLVDPDVERVLAAMGAVGGTVVWNDLLRSAWSRVAIRVATLGLSKFLRDDAILSVEKGFTAAEAARRAASAGLTAIAVRQRRALGRFVLTASADRRPASFPPA
jgi:hypothetical protein